MSTERFAGCAALKETAKAVLVRMPEGSEFWIPKSCIDEDSEVFAEGDEGELVVATWFAEKEGLF